MNCSFGHSVSPVIRHRSGILVFLVAGYVALLPYLFQVGDRLNFAPSDCFLLLVPLLAATQLKYRGSAWPIWHIGILLIFALGSFVAVLRFGQLDRYELLNKDAGLLLPFLSYAAITSIVTEWEDVRRILRVFTLSVVAENLLAIGGFMAAYFFGIVTPFTRYEGLRLSGMLLDPNAYGGLLVVALVICEAASWGRAPLFRSSLLWFSRLTLTLGILFTFSRSAWLGLGLAFVLLFAIRPALALRPVLTGVFAAPCLILLMGRRFLPILEELASRPKQVQERFDLIHQALRAFARHPLLGGGLGSFRLAAGEVAHNSAMWFLADFGIAGLAALVAFLAWFFTKAWFTYRFAPEREQPIALALFLAHAAMVGVAMGIEAFYQRHWWLVLALIASGYTLALRTDRCQRRDLEVVARVYA
ncbi:MAG TPA: O-antigen ligase family protein [Bryobacteraceae bacterium]|nr:O-antigen ligase family protein [Bryobacteraceae bacterium]